MSFEWEIASKSIPKQHGPIVVGRGASEHFRDREDVVLPAQVERRQAAAGFKPATAAVVVFDQRASELQLYQ